MVRDHPDWIKFIHIICVDVERALLAFPLWETRQIKKQIAFTKEFKKKKSTVLFVAFQKTVTSNGTEKRLKPCVTMQTARNNKLLFCLPDSYIITVVYEITRGTAHAVDVLRLIAHHWQVSIILPPSKKWERKRKSIKNWVSFHSAVGPSFHGWTFLFVSTLKTGRVPFQLFCMWQVERQWDSFPLKGDNVKYFFLFRFFYL